MRESASWLWLVRSIDQIEVWTRCPDLSWNGTCWMKSASRLTDWQSCSSGSQGKIHEPQPQVQPELNEIGAPWKYGSP